jgi:hypothetical protein
MSNEVKATTRLSFSKGGAKTSRGQTNQVDVTGDDYDQGVQIIGTSNEVLTVKADLGTAILWCYFKNLDATNFIEIGNQNGGAPIYFVKLAAGDACVLPVDVTRDNIACKADTASCRLEFIVVEA